MNDMELSLKQKQQNWTTIATRCNTPKNTVSDVLDQRLIMKVILEMRPNARGAQPLPRQFKSPEIERLIDANLFDA